jgi:hypothetical protein
MTPKYTTTKVLAPMLLADGYTGIRTQLNSNELAQSIAAEFDGWSALAETALRLNAWAPKHEQPSYYELAAEIVAGADPDEVGRRIIADQDAARLIDATDGIVRNARKILNEEVTAWLDIHGRQIADSVLGKLGRIVNEVKRLLPELDAVNDARDLSRRPEAAKAWGQLESLANDFQALRRAHLILCGITLLPSWWPNSELIASYETLWPDFDLITDYENIAMHGSPVRINRVAPPWEDFTDAQFVRWLAEAKIIALKLPANANELATVNDNLRIAASERLLKRSQAIWANKPVRQTL